MQFSGKALKETSWCFFGVDEKIQRVTAIKYLGLKINKQLEGASKAGNEEAGQIIERHELDNQRAKHSDAEGEAAALQIDNADQPNIPNIRSGILVFGTPDRKV